MDRANDAVLFVGRILMAALFLPSGIAKALDFNSFAASLASQGLPFAEAWAAAAVAIEIVGPIALILGFLPSWTALVLIAFVIVVSATSHRYWEFAEGSARRIQEISFFKTLAIIAGLQFYYVSGAGAWSVAGWMAPKPAPQSPQTA